MAAEHHLGPVAALAEGSEEDDGPVDGGRAVRWVARRRARPWAVEEQGGGYDSLPAEDGVAEVPSLHDAMVAMLAAPLSSLIELQAQVRFGAVTDQWDLPTSDRLTLRRFGLPVGPLLRAAPQAETSPALTPNVAGDLERRLISADHRLYLLGVYGAAFDTNLSIRVGAVAGTGRVLGIRGRPLTTDDIPEQLRPYHPNLYHPAVCYFNSSVAAFVEIAWRWRAAVELLRAYPEPHYTAPLHEHEHHHAEVDRFRATFLENMTRIDPTLGDRDLDSPWVETITEDL
ncbi:SUKH-4 family immunity protein [Micromonospora sp. NPDC048835]|uniref:SUKH-4 family immunity protein n=1 Tax=Micromonospora sp. NPDC048835 TaxID=3155147 RepID=UPI0033DD80C6